MIVSFFRFLYRLLCWIDFFLATFIMYILSWLPLKITNLWYPLLFRQWCKVFIRAMGVDLKLHQKNTKPLPEQYIVIGNHPSAFEDVGMPALFKARYLAKLELKDWFILGRISVHAGTLYVRREDKASRKQAAGQIREALKQGDSIGIYPEGGCKGKRIHLPFHFGAFDIALEHGIPILPVFLHYEAQETFEWTPYENLIQKIKAITFAPNRTANYYVFDPIEPNQFENKEILTIHVQNLYLEWQKKYLE